MTFHTKLRLVQNVYVSTLIKYIGLLESMTGQDIKYYSITENTLPFKIELDTLLVKKIVFHMLFVIIFQEYKLIY